MATDFKSALERAKAVAAKLTGTTPATTGTNYSATINNGNSNGNSLKRNLDDDDTIVGNLKKMAYSNTSLDDNNLSNSINQNQQQRSNNGNTFFKPSSVYLDGVTVNGEKTLDIMIPGNKVGFIIGKGGEMIRQLQERANVKMTIIQQSSEVTDSQKQLRIVGDTSKVDYAQQLVKELLVEKEMELLKYKNKPNPSNEYGSIPQNYIEIPVSPQYIGLVIGKGGENIKRISQETGAKVAVDTSKTDSNGNKLCQISALNLNAVNTAADMVKEILDNAMNNKRVPAPGSEEVKISVPQNKTGIVIGKGGETIRSIKQQCGCNIELEKNSKGIFIIRGPADRIQYAQQLIGEKVGTQVTVLSSTMQNSQNSNYTDQYWAAASQAQFSGYSQDPTASSSVSNNQDSNAAAWAAYYAQYYSQVQMGQQLPVDANAPNSAAAMNAGNPPASQMPMGAPAGAGDQDYSAQWAEWYRFYGMEKEAEMVEQMAKKKNSSCT